MKRTTILLDDNLARKARQLAERSGTTFTAVVAEALREAVARRPGPRRRRRVVLPSFRGEGLCEGVDLANNAATLDLMERNVPADRRR
jgi:hypothetical protein